MASRREVAVSGLVETTLSSGPISEAGEGRGEGNPSEQYKHTSREDKDVIISERSSGGR